MGLGKGMYVSVGDDDERKVVARGGLADPLGGSLGLGMERSTYNESECG